MWKFFFIDLNKYKAKDKFSDNRGHNTLEIFDILENIPISTSKGVLDF